VQACIHRFCNSFHEDAKCTSHDFGHRSFNKIVKS
jgi:hypothetical protein